MLKPRGICQNKHLRACLFIIVIFLFLYLYYTKTDLRIVPLKYGIFLGNRLFMNTSIATDHIQENDSTSVRSRLACIHPQLRLDDPVMIKFLKKLPPIRCRGEPDWVYVENGTLKFSSIAKKKHGSFHCDYYPLERVGDDDIKWGHPLVDIPDKLSITSDFFRVSCRGDNGSSYSGVHSGIAYTKDRANLQPQPIPTGLDGLSIAILGFDSMSRMSWLRRLNKTRDYFHNKLGGIELEAHNIVGDGTTAVMFPMLTGKFEWELPECRRNHNGATTLDNFPWLWHEMRRAGYLTSWCNAAPHSAPFNWRMLGFSEQPTDFYTRPFYLAASSLYSKYSKYCIGTRTQVSVWLDYFRDIFFTYKHKRKFLYHFITDFSHDENNLITMVDDDLQAMLQMLWEGDYLNNTILILMGDHGARYSHVRSTWSGKLEERLPYFGFLFPSWFEKKYPQAIRNLRINTKRLTTPFDLYETFRDVLNFDGTGQGNISNRGISLFKEIPPERSCEHASIAPHWCACLAWKNISVQGNDVQNALKYALDTINNFTDSYRDKCSLLFIANVTMATKLETRSEVLKFKKTDSDGGIYKIDLTAQSKNEIVLYQLTFHTTPGGAHYEVTVTHDLVHQKYLISEQEISRINKYGNDPACILDKNRQIRQYCYCKNNIRS